MKRVAIAAAAAALGMICSTAFAADLTPAYRTPVPAVTPAYSWTNVYIGINGGYGWGSQDPFDIITDRFDQFSTGISGGVVGGTIGAQVQVSYVVIGAEADLDWAGIKGSTTATPTIGGTPVGSVVNAQTNINWLGTARLRVGVAANNWLFYTTGGLAVLGAKTQLTTVSGGLVCGGAIFSGCSGADRQVGGVAGLGVEYGFTPALSAKLEYLYITAASLEVSRQSEIRAGLNYHLGGF